MGKNWIAESFIPGLVSVVIPSYNRQGFLKEAIESVIAQIYRPIESIVVDDGSTDGTKEMMTELMQKNTDSFTLKYIYQQNSGSQVARNAGTKASAGEYIQYLDSDDLLFPEKLAKQVFYLQSHKDIDGVFGDWEKGTPQRNELIQAWDSDDMITQLLTGKVVHTLAFLFRRNIVNKIGEWDVNIRRNQEIDFQVSGILAGGQFKYQSQTCGLWRIHEGERIANTTGAKDFIGFYHKWEELLSLKGLFNEKMKQNISNIYFWLAWENKKNINNKKASLNLLVEAFRLNPQIPFVTSKKMKLLRKLFPIKMCIKLWWYWAKRNASNH